MLSDYRDWGNACLRKLFEYIKPYSFLIFVALFLKTLAAFAELFIPKLLAEIVDEAIPANDISRVYMLGAVMIGMAVLALFGNIFANRFAAINSGKITQNIRHDLFEKTIRLDLEDADKYGTSSLISRLTSDTYNINSMIGRMQRMGVRAPILLVGGIIITLTINARLTLILVAVLPFVAGTVYYITKKTIPIYTDVQKNLDDMVRTVEENAAGVRVIKALSKSEYEKGRFHAVNDRLVKREIYASALMALTNPLTGLFLNLGLCAVIAVGAYISLTESAISGKLLAFMTYFTIILNAMIGVTKIFVMLSRGIASARRITEVLETPARDRGVPAPARESGGYLVFDDVSFSYNKNENNLDGISFSLKKGETLGIIGATGSGKSTIVSLLNNFYSPDKGNIYIDGTDIRAVPNKKLRKMIGTAFQNDFITTATVSENISFFRGISDEDIKHAAAVAQADQYINELEGGYGHDINARGTNLSGGQKQRLLIARALAAKPDILILDDSASALDYKTDMNLRREIKNALKDTTTVIIAQRISSIKNADLIIVLNDGKIIGKGTHEELLASCEEYREISEIQMGGVANA